MTMKSRLLILSGAILIAARLHPQSTTSGIVISQIYGGGGNSGATLRNDFVELFNRSDKAVTINGWSIQYASASGTSWDRTLLSGTIQPGQYFLVEEAQGNSGSASLPSADSAGGINLSATDGKLVLVNNSTGLSGAAPSGSAIVDFVGYGSANASEGSPGPALTNTTAAFRGSSGCTDTNNNRSDFSSGSPAPRNSHSAVHLCAPIAPASKPDLVITNLTAPTSGVVGATLPGTSAVVKNQGAAAAGAFRVGFYLSPTAGVTASSVSTGTSCISSGLASGGTFNCTASVAIPPNLSSGTWYLLALADDQNQVDESDESNNARAADSGPAILSGGTNPTGACGVERWPVKTGTDADANLVNLNNPSVVTIAGLVALAAPANKPENNRVAPTETTVFALNATLTQYKLESDDSDYHLVLIDSAGRTVIAEIPLPGCVGSGSPFTSAIANARSAFNAQLTATTTFKTANIPVLVRGVGFFDVLHGQTGVAPNGIELHPVLDIAFNPTPTITSVTTAGGFQGIAQNDWIEIKGSNLVPPDVGPNGATWSSAPEFAAGRMPTQLNNVSVKVNGKAAYVYYISDKQINVLTPLDDTFGAAPIVVTNGAVSSAAFTATMRAEAPSLLLFGASKYVVATHADGSLLGPTALSVPGYTFTPARPGETIVLWGVGFGLPATTLVEGSATQFGALPTPPLFQIDGATVQLLSAAVVSPGLYQFNVVVPDATGSGDKMLAVNYRGLAAPNGLLISVGAR